jgi:hypothetical protein
MPSKAIVYKVLQRNLNSFNVGNSSFYFKEGVGIQYKVGEWVKPVIPKSRLFAFEHPNQAFGMLERLKLPSCNRMYPVFMAEGLQVSPFKRSLPDCSQALDFWNGKKIIEKHNYPGTVGCTAIKILTEIRPVFKVLCEDMGSTNPNRWNNPKKDERDGTLLYYKQNEWTMPTIPKSKLFAFDNLTDALAFSNGVLSKVWRAYGINITPLPAAPTAYDIDHIRRFWETGKADSFYNIPTAGMITCDSIMVTEVVDSH